MAFDLQDELDAKTAELKTLEADLAATNKAANDEAMPEADPA